MVFVVLLLTIVAIGGVRFSASLTRFRKAISQMGWHRDNRRKS